MPTTRRHLEQAIHCLKEAMSVIDKDGLVHYEDAKEDLEHGLMLLRDTVLPAVKSAIKRCNRLE